jgi:hypothetical protein
MSNRRMTVLFTVLFTALIAATAVMLLQEDDPSLVVGEPQVLSASQLSELAESTEPIYWLGEKGGREYEVTETASGHVYVRYPHGDGDAGDEQAELLTVGTYPSKDGVAALRRAVRNRSGAKLGRTDDGAVLLIDPGSPNNAHLAYPDTDIQVEIFSPDPGEALRFAARGDVRPVP